jgi:hypothetical protein
MEVMRNTYKIFCWKACRGETTGRLRHRWEDNIRMDFREIGWKVMD